MVALLTLTSQRDSASEYKWAQGCKVSENVELCLLLVASATLPQPHNRTLN